MLTQRHMRSYPHWKWRSIWGIIAATGYAAGRATNVMLEWDVRSDALAWMYQHVLPYLVIVGLLGMFIQGLRIARMLTERRQFPHYQG